MINVWGADHQGQVPSLLAGVEALGVERGRLEVRLGQMVSLASGRIGKRLGNAVDLDDLVADIGPDVMRLLSLVAPGGVLLAMKGRSAEQEVADAAHGLAGSTVAVDRYGAGWTPAPLDEPTTVVRVQFPRDGGADKQ